MTYFHLFGCRRIFVLERLVPWYHCCCISTLNHDRITTLPCSSPVYERELKKPILCHRSEHSNLHTWPHNPQYGHPNWIQNYLWMFFCRSNMFASFSWLCVFPLFSFSLLSFRLGILFRLAYLVLLTRLVFKAWWSRCGLGCDLLNGLYCYRMLCSFAEGYNMVYFPSLLKAKGSVISARIHSS